MGAHLDNAKSDAGCTSLWSAVLIEIAYSDDCDFAGERGHGWGWLRQQLMWPVF
jgi:hypothetical protein